MSQYKRVLLKGLLITRSNLHIGTGNESTIETKEGQQSYNEICLNHEGKPYIPASTMRGYLRKTILNNSNKSTADKIFGTAKESTENSPINNAKTSKDKIVQLRVYDAYSHIKYQPHLQTRTSIDPLTATAKTHHLSTHATVPEETSFALEIEIDNIDDQELEILLKALNTLGETGKIGKGKSTGQGELSWTQLNLKILTESSFKHWINEKPNKKTNIVKQLKEHFYDHKEMQPKEINLNLNAFSNDLSKITFKLDVKSPLLINDPEATEKANKEREEKDKIDHIFMQKNGNAIIQGSTIKGWVRARCEKILLTLINKQESNQASKIDHKVLSNQLFGSTNQQGIIEFNAAKVKIQEHEKHHQTFNAIDRFSGGVKAHALYNAEAIWPEAPFVFSINYQQENLKNWMKLLLLFVIRDAMEGDLVLGWGKSKGFGRLTLFNDEKPDWKSLYETLDENDLKTWQSELNKELGLQQQQGETA